MYPNLGSTNSVALVKAVYPSSIFAKCQELPHQTSYGVNGRSSDAALCCTVLHLAPNDHGKIYLGLIPYLKIHSLGLETQQLFGIMFWDYRYLLSYEYDHFIIRNPNRTAHENSRNFNFLLEKLFSSNFKHAFSKSTAVLTDTH